MIRKQFVSEVATEDNQLATPPRYGDKEAVAAMLGMSKRTVENLMAQGCPHLALGKRRTRFDMQEVRTWLTENFHTQRRGKLHAEGAQRRGTA